VQIETQINLLIDVHLAAGIPLVP
jgi:hypothetical protein